MADGFPAIPLVIIGAGGHGRELLDIVEALACTGAGFEFLGFVDDGAVDLQRLSARRARLLAGLDDKVLDGAWYLAGIGDPVDRREVSERADARGLQAATVCHPSATFGAVNTMGEGFVACAQVSVTTNVSIGRHVHLNVNANVAHDCVLGDFVTVNPGANLSGDVRLGHGVMVGTGAAIIQGVEIGAGTIVGAGAVVTRDLPAGVVAMGCPARPVRDLG